MTPILEPDGKITREKGKIVFEQQFGELTCYHIAHSDRWKEESNGEAKKPPVSEDGKGESNNKQKNGKQHTVSADSKGEGERKETQSIFLSIIYINLCRDSTHYISSKLHITKFNHTH